MNRTELRETTASQYDLGALREALEYYRIPVPRFSVSKKQPKGQCECGRILRASEKVAFGGPIVCGVCNSEFVWESESD